jgi:hypothetical protein
MLVCPIAHHLSYTTSMNFILQWNKGLVLLFPTQLSLLLQSKYWGAAVFILIHPSVGCLTDCQQWPAACWLHLGSSFSLVYFHLVGAPFDHWKGESASWLSSVYINKPCWLGRELNYCASLICVSLCILPSYNFIWTIIKHGVKHLFP